MSVFENLPQTLMNFGIEKLGYVEKQYPLFNIMAELDAGYPCIGICDARKNNEINRNGGIFSFVADGYAIRQFKGLDVYADGHNCERVYTEYFFNLRLSNLDLIQPHCFYNWCLFDPNQSKKIQSSRNLRSPLAYPAAALTYNEMYVLTDIGSDSNTEQSSKRKTK